MYSKKKFAYNSPICREAPLCRFTWNFAWGVT